MVEDGVVRQYAIGGAVAAIFYIEPINTVMSAEHLVAIMLQTGRLKDYARMQQFLEQGVVNLKKLGDVVSRHNLDEKWNAFKENICDKEIS